MERSRLLNTLLAVLIVIAALYLAQMLWQLISGFSDLILLFLLGWLVSFILNPVVTQFSQYHLPAFIVGAMAPILGPRRTKALNAYSLPRPTAVIVVYFGLVLALVLAIALVIPPAIAQSSQIASQLPEYYARAPETGAWIQNQFARWGVGVNFESAMQGALGSVQSIATGVIQNALGIFTVFLSLIADLFFVLILGFYFTLDGPRLGTGLLKLIPTQYNDQARFFAHSVDRTFGGFIRGQLVQALLVGIGTGVVMTLLGMKYMLVASLLAGIVMLIPLLGPILALIPPLFIALFQVPTLALWLMIALFIYQFAVVNVLMPRLLSEAVGLHPLLVFAAILVSTKVAGFWGAFFGIPVAGVLWAMFEFFFRDLKPTPMAALPAPNLGRTKPEQGPAPTVGKQTAVPKEK
ncbi:MAG: AI-2E family transporter [Chloroflexi bacterium]|nr:AI-2E family transporter [Chloroflexota bacterium]